MKVALRKEKYICLGIAVGCNEISIGFLFWVLDIKF